MPESIAAFGHSCGLSVWVDSYQRLAAMTGLQSRTALEAPGGQSFVVHCTIVRPAIGHLPEPDADLAVNDESYYAHDSDPPRTKRL